MRKAIVSIALLLSIALMGSAFAQTPAVGFDIESAMGVNFYYFNFFGDQVQGNVFTVVGDQDLLVTHLGAFDMNPDNEPYWDVENPTLAEHGFMHDHGVALFEYPSMAKIGEVILPAGTSAPIQDEGYRYLPLEDLVTLQVGQSYVIAAWWAGFNIADGGVDTFYLLGTSPTEIPSEVTIHQGIEIIDGCFNPAPPNGPSVDAPFVFNMFWGLQSGGANFLIDEPVAVQSKSWSGVKDLFQ